MQSEWLQMVAAEGTVGGMRMGPGPETEPDGEPPCPACGTAAPLVEGACSDCGLQLA